MSILSRKRLEDIKEVLKQNCEQDKVDEIITKFCEIMKYDPEKSTYTKEKGQKHYEKLKKKSKDEGVSLYILSGRKKHYENTKALKENV